MTTRLALVPEPGHRNSQGGTVRRDKRGRRIGHNWWREYVLDQWRCAYHTWWLAMEDATSLWATEVDLYKAEYPTPTFKQYLVGLAGTPRYQAA